MGPEGNICAICGAKYGPDAIFCPKDGAPLGVRAPKGTDEFIGLELPGRIRIERLIGIGSMGRVYRGFDESLGRPVAVKILHRELSANPTLVARFHREADIASRLSHPHVVAAMHSGQLPEALDRAGPSAAGAMYIVMEYLDGISLRSAFAAAGGSLPLSRALRIVLQLCDAVGEAHRAGVVHRDLKPENVMLLRRDGDPDFVKVLDFGIARLPGANTQAVTQAGAVFGTARYVSPEGAIGSPVGPPADVYAIATILYQALAGRTPFDGETTIEVLGRQINDPPPPLRSHERASRVPEQLAEAIMNNLAKRPEDRSPDARALGALLVEATRSSGTEVEPQGAATEPIGRTKQQAYGAHVARQIAAAQAASPAAAPATPPPRDEPRIAGSDADRSATTEPDVELPKTRTSPGALAFLVGCVAGGIALAAIAAYRSPEPSTGPAPTALGSPARDAGLNPDGEAR
jgi:serine/threonine-protein kinase